MQPRITENTEQTTNAILAARIQPNFFIENKFGGVSPRKFKQAKAFLNLNVWEKNKCPHMGIYLYLKIYNETIKTRLGGIGTLRIALDAWTLKHYLQYKHIFDTPQKYIDRKGSTVEKLTRYPNYWKYLEYAKQKGKLQRKHYWQPFNQTLKKDVKKVMQT